MTADIRVMIYYECVIGCGVKLVDSVLYFTVVIVVVVVNMIENWRFLILSDLSLGLFFFFFDLFIFLEQ